MLHNYFSNPHDSEYVSLISSDEEDMTAFMTSEYESGSTVTQETNCHVQSEIAPLPRYICNAL